MRVVHLIGGGDEGGAKSHVLSLVKALGAFHEVSLVSFRKGPFHDDAIAMGIDAHAFEGGGIAAEARQALRVVRATPCDLLHAHGAKGNLIGLILRRITGIPMITTVHSDYRLDYLHSLTKRLSYGLVNTVALRFIHNYVAVSENFRDMLTARGFDPQRIHAVYNGVPFDNEIPPCDRSDFFRRYSVPFPVDCILIGIAARLHPVKDHETFLKAAAKVCASHANARFLIAGPGDRQQLEKLAESLGIGDRVHFAGMVTEPFDFFQTIDINVLTSLSESFPYVILEGARCARATVSSRVGGLGDLFRQGRNGFLFEPRDVDALAGHLNALCTDRDLRTRMGLALYADAKARFSLESMCATQRAIYDRVLSDESRARQDGRQTDITLLGYYGYGNSGDEAILKSLTDTLRARRPGITFTILSRDPGRTRMSVKAASVRRFNLLRTVSAIRRSRLFVAGGGSLIQDNTSTRSIFYYLGMLSIARMCGARTMLLANGLGPISRPSNRRWARRVLDRLDAITLRDPDSLVEARTLGISQPTLEVTADPALLLTPADAAEAASCLTRMGVPADRPLIGFSVRKWVDSERTVDAVASLADHCVAAYGAVPVFLPMQKPDDETISRRIVSRMKHPACILSETCGPEMLMAICGHMELLVGMRLHSLIYAANMGTPMAGIVYEPKVSSFLEEAGQPVLCRIGEGDGSAWGERLDEIWSGRQESATALRQRVPTLRSHAARNVDVVLSLLESPLPRSK